MPLMARWSARYRWQGRVRAWDAQQERNSEQQHRKVIATEVYHSTLSARIKEENVLLELARIAFSDLRHVVAWDENGVRVKASDALDPDHTAPLHRVELREGKNGEKSVRIVMHDKMKALHDLAVMKQWIRPKKQSAEQVGQAEYLLFINAVLDPEKREKLRASLPERPPAEQLE
jgi:hypothetical protein